VKQSQTSGHTAWQIQSAALQDKQKLDVWKMISHTAPNNILHVQRNSCSANTRTFTIQTYKAQNKKPVSNWN